MAIERHGKGVRGEGGDAAGAEPDKRGCRSPASEALGAGAAVPC